MRKDILHRNHGLTIKHLASVLILWFRPDDNLDVMAVVLTVPEPFGRVLPPIIFMRLKETLFCRDKLTIDQEVMIKQGVI